MHNTSVVRHFREFSFSRLPCYFLFALYSHIGIHTLAQTNNLKFQPIGIESGLSHNNVTCILQDSDGFMWFGTRDGLNKYDGYEFTIYKNDPDNTNSLSHNWVQGIVEDDEGNLWIATLGGGLSVYNKRKDKFQRYQYNAHDPYSLASNFLNCITQDHDGNLWIGSDDRGVIVFNKASKQFINYSHHEGNPATPSDNSIKAIMEDHEHNLWIGTNMGGLDKFNPLSNTFTHYQKNNDNAQSIGGNSIWSLYEDSHHKLWIGTRDDGLDVFNPETEVFTHFRNDPQQPNSICSNVILSIQEDESGNMWIGTENAGLNIWNLETETYNHYTFDDVDKESLNSSSIWSIFKDDKGNIWVGTFNGGINFVNKDSNKFTHYRHTSSTKSLSDNSILTIFEDSNNNLWIGTDGGGLNEFDRKHKTFKHYKNTSYANSICGNHVIDITEDRAGNLWIGTWGSGLTVFNKERNSYRQYAYDPAKASGLSSPNIWALYTDSQNNVWIGTHGGGVNLYDKKTDSFIHFRNNPQDPNSLSSDLVKVILEDKKGNIWIGTLGNTTHGGLNLFDKNTHTFKCFASDSSKNSITDNQINCLLEGDDDDLWIGTNAGLNKLNRKTNTFTAYTLADGLPGNTIMSLLWDNHGNLWIGTNNGISKFNPHTKTFKNYSVSDGLQSMEFKKAACKSKTGQLYLGGNNGFNEFYPDGIKDIAYQPHLVLTDFQLFSKPVPISDNPTDHAVLHDCITNTKEITLAYDQSVFSFEFATLNYSFSEKKKYAYKMIGFDKDWNEVGTNHSATYTNLDPGEYTFNVKGLDNEGHWSPEEINLKITIIPPYWKTWWFRTLAGILLVGSVVAYYRSRVKSIQEQQIVLEEKVSQQTKELREQKDALASQAGQLLTLNDQLKTQADFLKEINTELQQEKEEAEKARQEAEQANRAKSTFLATMSHEIRTPMNGVIGMASLLSETSQTQEQQEYTDTIKSCGENLLVVINDILDYSKIESGKMDLEQNEFDLRTCVEEVFDIFGQKASQAGLDLIYEIDYNVPSQLIGDSVRLRQIIMNLLGNALKFTHDGEVYLGVHLLQVKNDEVELSFEVRDTGIGIEPDKIGRLFKVFSQVDSSTTRRYGGTGLGLVICEKLVKLMGGNITVNSTPGKGTTFTFTITACRGQQAVRGYRSAFNHLDGKRVLVVDDNQTNLTILSKQLKHWKLSATIATSGKEALQFLSSDPHFDLVITDMEMPEMNGVQLALEIKKQNATLPIILLSSIGDVRNDSNQHVFTSVLTKPVKQNLLFDQVSHALRNEKQQKETIRVNNILQEHFAESHPMRILLAEDNHINQKLTCRVLEKLGYNATLAENGLEAFDLADRTPFDLILMDIQMPEMDGLEVTQKIRKQLNLQPIIIAMTANAMPGDRDKCMQAGMNDYISKPIRLEELVNILRKWATVLQEKTNG